MNLSTVNLTNDLIDQIINDEKTRLEAEKQDHHKKCMARNARIKAEQELLILEK